MSSVKSSSIRLAAKYPHSEALLESFTPLLEAQEELAKTLTPPLLPPLDKEAFASGRAWLADCDVADEVFLDQPFLENAPELLCKAAAAGFPAVSEAALALGRFLSENPEHCRELAMFHIKGNIGKVRAWSERHGQDEPTATLLAVHLGGAAARRVALEAAAEKLPPWSRATCPVCGRRPHGAAIRGKEGKRWLQCSLCRHEWIFSRTTCPVCLQDDPQKTELFFIEASQQLRAEVCTECGHYLLCADTREMADDMPLELLLLCMMPLDLLMQEKKFIPVPRASAL